MVAPGLAASALVALALDRGAVRVAPFHLIVARSEEAGPAAGALAATIRSVVAQRLALP